MRITHVGISESSNLRTKMADGSFKRIQLFPSVTNSLTKTTKHIFFKFSEYKMTRDKI